MTATVETDTTYAFPAPDRSDEARAGVTAAATQLLSAGTLAHTAPYPGGEIDLQIATAETLSFGSLLRAETGDTSVVARVPLIRSAIARAVITAIRLAVAVLGNPGLTRRNPLERRLRHALCIRVHPPQEDAALLAAGRRVLGG